MKPALVPLAKALQQINTAVQPPRIPERGPIAAAQAASGKNENREPHMTSADRITNLIAERPGIRTAEIADELGIENDLVRPLIQPRIANSRIIVDKVPGPTGLINAYRINPKWTPADANFAPAPSTGLDDDEKEPLPVRRTVVADPAQWMSSAPKQRAATTKKAKRPAAAKRAEKRLNSAPDMALPVAAKPAGSRSTSAPEASASTRNTSDLDKFACAVFHDGRGEIRAGVGRVILTPDQVAIVAAHFARFPREAMV